MVAAQVVRGHRRHKRKCNALDMDVSTSVYQEALLIEREQRGRKVDALLRTFEDKTGVLVGAVAPAATELRATADTLSGTTGDPFLEPQGPSAPSASNPSTTTAFAIRPRSTSRHPVR
jgi:hypothetical protein